MSEAFLGTGWSFPVRPGRGGDVELAEHEESIRQSIWLVLGTSPGERVMRPDFGCNLADLVFSVGGAHTAGAAEDEVRRALIRWEPRADVLSVVATPEPGRLSIRIEVRVRATNTVFNLVYPFYLEGGAA